jgi:hypothetical protein
VNLRMGKTKCGEDDQGESGLTATGGRWRMFKAVCSAKAGLWLASGITGRKLHTDASLFFCSLQKGGKQAL